MSGPRQRSQRMQLLMEEEELRSLRIPTSVHRGNLSPSKNSFIPSLQGEGPDPALSASAAPSSPGGLGASLGSSGRLGASGGSRGGAEATSESAANFMGRGQSWNEQQVIADISADLLESVKQDFISSGGSLSLDEFSKAMLRCLEPTPQLTGPAKKQPTSVRFTESGSGGYPAATPPGGGPPQPPGAGGSGRAAAVIDLFRRVDVHSEGAITWEEVSNYLIEQGASGGEQFTVDSIKTYEPSQIADQSKHDSLVEKLVYCEQMDTIVCMSQSSRSFRLYDPKRCTLKGEVSGHRGSVISCCYVDTFNQLATTSADMTVCMWDPTSLVLRNRIPTKDVQLCVQWDSSSKSLFSGSIDGTLSRFDLQDMCLADMKRGAHKKAINDLLMVQDINLLASAASDGSILMWDTATMRPKKSFKGHKKGTFSLAYSNEYRCLLTAGLDQAALVWNPYVEKVPIFRLKGHTHALCGIAVVPGTPQILSADVAGVFRLWDMRNFRCMQSFGGPDAQGSDLSSFCVMPPHRRLAAGGARIALYDYMDEWGGESFTDTAGVTDALYNPKAGEFYTISKRTVKAWQADTGVLFKVMRDIAQQEITAACMADNGRKVYLGDAAGRVAAHSLNNGRVLTEFEPHSTDISCLAVWHGTNKLFSSSWDGVVKVQSDEGPRHPQLKAEFHHHRDGVTCLACSPELMLLATGGTDMQVCFYDLKNLKLDYAITKLPHVIVGLDFLPERCLLAMVDHGGLLSLWRTRPHPEKWTRVHHFRNLPVMHSLTKELHFATTAEEQRNRSQPPIAFGAVSFAPPGPPNEGRRRPLLLYTADTKGGLRCWDLAPICERRGVVECDLPALFEREYLVQLKLAQGGGPGFQRNGTPVDPAATAIAGPAGAAVGATPDGGGGGPFLTGVEEEASAEQPAAMAAAASVRRSSGGSLAGVSPEVPLLFEVQGHDDGVLNFHIDTEPFSLLSCGQDRRVCTWSSRLESLGVLLQSKDLKYRFPYDRGGARQAKLDEAAELLRRIGPLTPPAMLLPPIAQHGTRSAPDLAGLEIGGKRRPKAKKDLAAMWRISANRVIEDPDPQEEDYQILFDQMERLGSSVLPAPLKGSAPDRLMRDACARSAVHVPQRSTALSRKEAAAADRLAGAMAALGSDEFGTFSTMAKSIRPASKNGRGASAD